MNARVRDTFGVEVQYLPVAGGTYAIKAAFDETQRMEDTANKTYAVFFVVLADLPAAPARGDRIQYGTKNYKVWEIKADQAGGAQLLCHA